jgi:hypothetical protein
MPTLLGDELRRMVSVHVEPLARVPRRQPRQLSRVPDLQPRVLRGVPPAERCLVLQARVRLPVVLGDVPVGQAHVLVTMPDVERLVRR